MRGPSARDQRCPSPRSCGCVSWHGATAADLSLKRAPLSSFLAGDKHLHSPFLFCRYPPPFSQMVWLINRSISQSSSVSIYFDIYSCSSFEKGHLCLKACVPSECCSWSLQTLLWLDCAIIPEKVMAVSSCDTRVLWTQLWICSQQEQGEANISNRQCRRAEQEYSLGGFLPDLPLTEADLRNLPSWMNCRERKTLLKPSLKNTQIFKRNRKFPGHPSFFSAHTEKK